MASAQLVVWAVRGAETSPGGSALKRSWCAYSAGLFLVLVLCGCATLPGGREWGQDVTLKPGWHRVRDAAIDAVESPRFWGPLAAAAVFQVDGWDRKTSNWARGHTPIFGSQQNAADWSDHLRAASLYAYAVSVLATPSGSDPKEWMLDKLGGVAVGLAAIGVTDGESVLLKNAAARERPNGQDTQSMPSSHTSRSAVLTELAQRNVESLALGPTTRNVLEFGLDALTYGTAWARVESGFHYPSDTLVSMSLGTFNGAFFNDAFLGVEQHTQLSFSLTPLPRGAVLGVRFGL
jgi:membrane-associated phospholipid phosphatase